MSTAPHTLTTAIGSSLTARSASGETTQVPLLLTETEHASFHRELERLREIRDHDLPQLRREARTYVAADAAEEIAQIQGGQTVIESRIVRLEALLSDARVVSATPGPEIVSLGCAAEVEYLRSGTVVTYRIAGAGAGEGPRTVSARSPVGQALMGQTPGAVVSAELPGGRLEELRILSVQPDAISADRGL